jgi:hypothetical protein
MDTRKRRKLKKLSRLMIATIIAIVMIVPAPIFATTDGLQVDNTQPGKSLAGMYPAQKVALQISLSEDAEQSVDMDVRNITDADLTTAINEGNVKLSLVRDQSRQYLDPKLFPNPYEGGSLSTAWMTQKSSGDEQMITLDSASLENGKLKLTLDSKCYFYDRSGNVDYSVPHSNGGNFLDRCGYFTLKAAVGDQTIGAVTAKVVPYDSYRTVYELYDEIEKLANTSTGLYVEKLSMGQTSVEGYDMPTSGSVIFTIMKETATAP